MMRRDSNSRRAHMTVLLMVLLLLILTGCQRQPEAYSYFSAMEEAPDTQQEGEVIILTHSQEETSPIHKTALTFKRQIESLAGGRYRVEIYPANSYGRLVGGYDAIKNGTIEIRIGGNNTPCADILSWLPAFAEVNSERLTAQLQEGGELYQMMLEECDLDGCHLLGVLSPTYRVMTANTPICCMEDLSGLNIRITAQEAESLFWGSLSADYTTQYDIDQVYTALQMGLIDAEENSVDVIFNRKFYEHQNYLIKSNHRFQLNAMFINGDFWERLGDEDRQLFQETADSALRAGDACTEAYQTIYEQVLRQNVEILELPDEEQDIIRRKAGGAVRTWLEQIYGEQLVSRIVDCVA